jgi:hypothetical protein
MATGVIVELQRNSPKWVTVVEDIVKLERKIFPKHESLARSFDEELRKKNSGLLYIELDGAVAGYVMYSWPSSLYASITKLAGFKPFSFRNYFFMQSNWLSCINCCLCGLVKIVNMPITCSMKVPKETLKLRCWVNA